MQNNSPHPVLRDTPRSLSPRVEEELQDILNRIEELERGIMVGTLYYSKVQDLRERAEGSSAVNNFPPDDYLVDPNEVEADIALAKVLKGVRWLLQDMKG